MISRTSILIGLIFLTIVLGRFITNDIVFILLAAIGLFVGISQFIIDRREVKDALNSSRIDEPIWRQVLGFVFVFGCVYLVGQTGLADIFYDTISLYIIFIYIGVIFASYYRNFFHSIRSYSDGLKLPGRESQLIPWGEVDEISLSKEKARMVLSGEIKEMDIDRRDKDDFLSIIDSWENEVLPKVPQSR